MKPFFSIRIDYNPADSEGLVAFDENSIRLSLARETERDSKRMNYETWQNVAMKITLAIKWFRDNADPYDEGLISALFFEMRSDYPQLFLESVKDAAESGDDDEIDKLRTAIKEGREAAGEPTEDDEP